MSKSFVSILLTVVFVLAVSVSAFAGDPAERLESIVDRVNHDIRTGKTVDGLYPSLEGIYSYENVSKCIDLNQVKFRIIDNQVVDLVDIGTYADVDLYLLVTGAYGQGANTTCLVSGALGYKGEETANLLTIHVDSDVYPTWLAVGDYMLKVRDDGVINRRGAKNALVGFNLGDYDLSTFACHAKVFTFTPKSGDPVECERFEVAPMVQN